MKEALKDKRDHSLADGKEKRAGISLAERHVEQGSEGSTVSVGCRKAEVQDAGL